MLRTLMAATLIAIVPFGPARAADVGFGSPAVSQELTRVWAGFCLERFPVDTAVNAFAASQGATPMSPQDVKRYLHDDPGRGWYLHTELGLYAITLEQPPFLACAVRRMTPNGVPGVSPFIAVMKAYSENQHGKLVTVPAVHTKTPDGGGDINAYTTGMIDATGKLRESFLVVLTNYHGHPPDPWKHDAEGGVGVEVRFVRELAKP